MTIHEVCLECSATEWVALVDCKHGAPERTINDVKRELEEGSAVNL